MPRWFRKKTIGYGWTPSTWQGWGVIALLMTVPVVLSQLGLHPKTYVTLVLLVFVASIAIIAFTCGRDSDV